MYNKVQNSDLFLPIQDQLPNVAPEQLGMMNDIKIPELKDDIVEFVGTSNVDPLSSNILLK